MNAFKLRFSAGLIRPLAEEYQQDLGDSDRKLEDEIEKDEFPSCRENEYLTKDEFLKVCEWKTPRTKSLCEKNTPEFIEEISKIVLKAQSERLRIEILTLLHGVGWPIASVFLHFAFNDLYPILDRRALWSLNMEEPWAYHYDFWERYAAFCRKLAKSNGVSMRTLDRALWEYSEKHQTR